MSQWRTPPNASTNQHKALQSKIIDGFCHIVKNHIQTCRRCQPFSRLLTAEVVERETKNSELAQILVNTKVQLEQTTAEHAKCAPMLMEIEVLRRQNAELRLELSKHQTVPPELAATKKPEFKIPRMVGKAKVAAVGLENMLNTHAMEHPDKLAQVLTTGNSEYNRLESHHGYRGGHRGRGFNRGRKHWYKKPYERFYHYTERDDRETQSSSNAPAFQAVPVSPATQPTNVEQMVHQLVQNEMARISASNLHTAVASSQSCASSTAGHLAKMAIKTTSTVNEETAPTGSNAMEQSTAPTMSSDSALLASTGAQYEFQDEPSSSTQIPLNMDGLMENFPSDNTAAGQ